jgi:hypothetical protein
MKLRRAIKPDSGDNLWDELDRELPDFARCYIDAARDGGRSAASSLVFAAPNHWRGLIALAAYYSGVPNPGYREIIRSVWNHDHDELLSVTENNIPLIRRMLRAADFRHPFSGRTAIYRGASGVNLAQATKGLAWTSSWRIACWFACRFATETRPPIVVKASVDAADVIYWDNSRKEQEVILRTSPTGVLDHRQEKWTQSYTRVVDARHRAAQLRLKHAAKSRPPQH